MKRRGKCAGAKTTASSVARNDLRVKAVLQAQLVPHPNALRE